MNTVEARLRLVRTYQQTGSVQATAWQWQTSRQVVCKWVVRSLVTVASAGPISAFPAARDILLYKGRLKCAY